MTELQMIITIAIIVLGTMTTRFISFIVFTNYKEPPAIISYLGKALPGAVMGMLVVYSYKDTPILTGTHGIPELIATVITVSLHLWRRNMLLSMVVGTVVYMILVQIVFK